MLLSYDPETCNSYFPNNVAKYPLFISNLKSIYKMCDSIFESLFDEDEERIWYVLPTNFIEKYIQLLNPGNIIKNWPPFVNVYVSFLLTVFYSHLVDISTNLAWNFKSECPNFLFRLPKSFNLQYYKLFSADWSISQLSSLVAKVPSIKEPLYKLIFTLESEKFNSTLFKRFFASQYNKINI